MVNHIKFSEFTVAPLTSAGNQVVGLESGVNVKSIRFLTWTTATRPATPFNGLLGFNTTLQQYEFWDALLLTWTQLEDSGDINDLLARLASHAVGEGASLIGLQDQSNVTSKTVQDLANATFIAQASNGSLQNAQYLGSLATGIVKNTAVTGVLSISAPLTSIDGLTTVANNMLYTSAPNVYATIAPVNSAILISSAGGVPSWSNSAIPPYTMAGNINMGGFKATNAAEPSANSDYATKFYVDQTSLNGTSVYAASAASLGTVTQAGAGVGATLTNAGVQATFALDGVNPPVGSNVLIKNTAVGMTAANEGIYTVTNAGSGATNWVLTRATGYDTTTEINNTGLIVVQNGSTLAGSAWYNTATIVTVDTTNFNFASFGTNGTVTSITAGTGITLTPSPITSTGSVALTIPVAVTSGGTGLTSTTINQLLYSSAANTIAGLPTVNSAMLQTTSAGVPSLQSVAWQSFSPTVTLVGGAGNTVPVYSTNTGLYCRIGNTVFVEVSLSGDGGAEGAGTGQINIALPIAASAHGMSSAIKGYLINGALEGIVNGFISGGASTIALIYWNTISTTTGVTGNTQNNTTRQINLSFYYEVAAL